MIRRRDWKRDLLEHHGLLQDIPGAILPRVKDKAERKRKPRRTADNWSLLKEKVDREFSLFIRRRDSFDGEHAVCVTCGKVRPIRGIYSIQCGHYQSRRFLPTRWDARNCAAQCSYCNQWMHGENERMAEHIDKRWGEGTAAMLRVLSRETWRPDVMWMQQKLEWLREWNGGKKLPAPEVM